MLILHISVNVVAQSPLNEHILVLYLVAVEHDHLLTRPEPPFSNL